MVAGLIALMRCKVVGALGVGGRWDAQGGMQRGTVCRHVRRRPPAVRGAAGHSGPATSSSEESDLTKLISMHSILMSRSGKVSKPMFMMSSRVVVVMFMAMRRMEMPSKFM